MQLDISNLVGPGRKPARVEAAHLRDIGEADLALLASGNVPAIQPAPLARITQRHHTVARLIAAGVPPGEVALITNYSASRISILQGDPAFQELVSLYQREVQAEFSTVLDNLAGLSSDAIEELRYRLEEEPENFSLKDLRETAELGLNRTGYPAAKTVENTVNINFGKQLEAARFRAKQAAQGQIVDAEILGDNE